MHVQAPCRVFSFFYAASILVGNASTATCVTPSKELQRRPGQHLDFLVAHQTSCRLDGLSQSRSVFRNKNPQESPNLPQCAIFSRDIQRFGSDTASRFNLHTRLSNRSGTLGIPLVYHHTVIWGETSILCFLEFMAYRFSLEEVEGFLT